MNLKYLLSIGFFGVGLMLHAQSDFVASGKTVESSSGSASYSIGQATYTENSSAEGRASAGVQQVYDIEETDGVENASIQLKVTAFPNPTAENVWLKVSDFQGQKMRFVVVDNVGKVVLNDVILSEETEIPLNEFPSATYHLIVSDENSSLKTFKILKFK